VADVAAKAGGEATDPVCGMTVPVTSRAVTADYGQQTYYFCGAGCRETFVHDPADYLKRDTRC
jgi:YHS domain-containing protein